MHLHFLCLRTPFFLLLNNIATPRQIITGVFLWMYRHCCSGSDYTDIFLSVSADFSTWNSLRSQHSPRCNVFLRLYLPELCAGSLCHFLCFYIITSFLLSLVLCIVYFDFFIYLSVSYHFICEDGIYLEKKIQQIWLWAFFLCEKLGPFV